MLKRAFAGVLSAVLMACSAPSAPNIAVHDAWARETGGAGMTAAYLTIENKGGADRLVGVRSSTGTATLHESLMEGSVMRMRPVDLEQGLAVPSNGKLVLAPGGLHVMVEGLTRPLVAGDRISMTLLFDKADPETVDVAVKPATEAPAVHQ